MNLIVSHSVYSCTLQPPLSSLPTCLSQRLARPHRPKQMQYASLGLQRVKGASIMPCTVQVAIRDGLTVPKSRARPRLHLQDFRTQPRACTQPTCTPLSPGSPLPLSLTHKGAGSVNTSASANPGICLQTLNIVPVAALGLSIPVPRDRFRTDRHHGHFADITTENALRFNGALPSTPLTMDESSSHPCTRMQWLFSVYPTPILSHFPRSSP